MMQKGVASLAVMALVALASATGGQTTRPAGTFTPNSSSISAPAARPILISQAGAANSPNPSQAPSATTAQPQAGAPAPTGTAPAAGTPARSSDCFGGNCDAQTPHIAISTPAPAPAPWLWQEKVSWSANLVLVVLGYVGILMGLSLLRKIEQQMHHVEETAQAAAESARTALVYAESRDRAERPWILMSVIPSQYVENGFNVIATNRGRGPGRIVSTIDEVVFAIDEGYLEKKPLFKSEPVAPSEPIILLPGESTELVAFSRGDLKKVCVTDERMKRVENWEEKLFIYGKVAYLDLAAPDEAPIYESSWFCWYIHGRQKSGMVMAGPPAYNRHT